MDSSLTNEGIVDVDTAAPVVSNFVSLVDDDELQIVDEHITHPAAHIAFDNDIVDVDSARLPPPRPSAVRRGDLSIVVDCDEVEPVPVHSSKMRNDEIAIVEATIPVGAPKKATACAACSDILPKDYEALILSRCRHSLCVSCGVRSVADGDIVDSNPPFSVRTMRTDPMCVVRRCRAPVSAADLLAALAPASADECFRAAAAAYHKWATADEAPNSHAGPSHITFPDFTADMAADALQGDIAEREDELFGDDFAGAYGSLWLWDKDFLDPSGAAGRWMCAACGSYHLTASSMSNGEADQEDMEGDSSIPDPPLYPHCANARAFGVKESIRRLTLVEEDSEKTETKSKSTKRGRSKRYRSAKSVQSSKRRRTTGFAKGTGYAGRCGAEWKGTSAKILQKTARVDAATAFWLTRIRCFIVRTDAAPIESWPCFMRILLRECKLTEHLSKVLINESIMDVGERVPVYVAALRVAAALNNSPSLRLLVAEPCENGRSIASLINSLSNQAALLSAGAGNSVLDARTKLLIKQIRRSIRGIKRHNLLKENARQNGLELRVSMNPRDYQTLADTEKKTGGETMNGIGKGEVTEELKKKYLEVIKEMQFATVPGLANASSFRTEAMKPSTSNVGRGQSMRRIVSEVSSLFSSLPLSWSSSILIRVDEDRYDFLRACVLGPEDTPYECGVFLFDIFLPPNYPESPPKFKLLTTGGGKVRFNPNLYANGKVCLSLLGTWSGPSWTPASTLLQVLVSIQSLILVPEPYFNEPGLERQMGTVVGKKSSEGYNANVRVNTARYAILDALRHPYNEFKVAVHAHFRLKRPAIENNLGSWFRAALVQCENVTPDEAVATTTSSTTASNMPVNTGFPDLSPFAPVSQAAVGAGDETPTNTAHMLAMDGVMANISNTFDQAMAHMSSMNVLDTMAPPMQTSGNETESSMSSAKYVKKVVDDIHEELNKLEKARANGL